MFKSSKNPNFNHIETLVSSRVHIKGDLKGEGSARIDGQVEGDIDLKGDLVVGEKGLVKGGIRVDNILVAGVVEGHITARGRAEVVSSGEVVGDIDAGTLVIEEGGIFTGTSRMPREKGKNREGMHKVAQESSSYGKKSQGGARDVPRS